jgi:5-methylcytosine-specific restriction endonuclease McrA
MTDNNRLQPTFDPRCGKVAGYIAHRRRSENACPACQTAMLIYNREYKKTHPASKVDRREYRAKWNQKNKERIAAQKRLYVRLNKEKIMAYQKAWAKANPEKVAANQKKRRSKPNFRVKNAEQARKRRAREKSNHYEPYTEQQVLELYGAICHLCHDTIDLTAPRISRKGKNWKNGLHIDHVIPISKGGADALSNVRPAHAICNLKKSSKHTLQNP